LKKELAPLGCTIFSSPHVTQVLVCDPRKNALLKAGNKNDRVDARKLAELLYLNKLNPVYHGEAGVRTLKELARSYLAKKKSADPHNRTWAGEHSEHVRPSSRRRSFSLDSPLL
jgi:hypothetical protein